MKSFGRASTALGCMMAMATAGCAPQAPAAPSSASVAAEVKAAIHTQLDAYAARDQAKAASILAPDIQLFSHGTPNVVGKAAAEQTLKAQLALPNMTLEVSNETVDVAASGDLAVYRATYRFSFTNPETTQPFSEVGNWVGIFKRQPDGVMRLSTDIISNTPSP